MKTTTKRIRNPFTTRTLSFSDLRAFLECPYGYVERMTFGFTPTATVSGAAGEVTHALAATSVEEREALLESRLEEVPAEQRTEVEELVRSYTEAADELARETEVRDREAEQLLSWRDPVTGWELKAKPDEIGFVYSDGMEVLQIADLKTASYLKPKHKKQLYFFGMLASLALGFTGPIKLVVRLLGSRTPIVFWYSHKATERSLEYVRSVIHQIEDLLAETEGSLADLQCTCGREHRSLSVLDELIEKTADKPSVARAA